MRLVLAPTAEAIILVNKYICEQVGNPHHCVDSGKIESAVSTAFHLNHYEPLYFVSYDECHRQRHSGEWRQGLSESQRTRYQDAAGALCLPHKDDTGKTIYDLQLYGLKGF